MESLPFQMYVPPPVGICDEANPCISPDNQWSKSSAARRTYVNSRDGQSLSSTPIDPTENVPESCLL